MARKSTFEDVKNKLNIGVLNGRSTMDKRATCPYRPFMDLTEFVFIEDSVEPVTTKEMEQWGVSKEELFAAAEENRKPAEFTLAPNIHADNSWLNNFINNELAGRKGVPVLKQGMVLIAATKDTAYGANVITDTKLFEKIANKAGTDIFVVPSSIREIMIMPANSGEKRDITWQRLNNIVVGGNMQHESEKECLSDHAYLYRRNAGFSERIR